VLQLICAGSIRVATCLISISSDAEADGMADCGVAAVVVCVCVMYVCVVCVICMHVCMCMAH
jgi:hypothetical protein